MRAALVAAMVAQVSISSMAKADEGKPVQLECLLAYPQSPDFPASAIEVTAYPEQATVSIVFEKTGYTVTNRHAAFTPDKLIFDDGGRYPATYVINRHNLGIEVNGSTVATGQCKMAEIKPTKF